MFFFFKALNFLWWLKVFAFSTTSFHFPRSWTQANQFLIFIWQISCLILFSHLYLGLPCDLLVRGLHLNIFLTVLDSTSTHELRILCGRHYLCGDVVPLRSPVPKRISISVRTQSLWSCLSACVGALWTGHWHCTIFHYHSYTDCSVCWTDCITTVTLFSLALFMLA